MGLSACAIHVVMITMTHERRELGNVGNFVLEMKIGLELGGRHPEPSTFLNFPTAQNLKDATSRPIPTPPKCKRDKSKAALLLFTSCDEGGPLT